MNLANTLKAGPPYQPWAAELVKKRRADNMKDDPNVRCMPRGALRIWTDDYYKRIIQTPERLLVITERNMQYRQIFTDGRPLPPDPNPTWNGYSTAKWEGDALVVHTIGFRDDLWLDSYGNPLTNAAKVTEKIRRPNFGTLEIEITIDDPKTYTAPGPSKSQILSCSIANCSIIIASKTSGTLCTWWASKLSCPRAELAFCARPAIERTGSHSETQVFGAAADHRNAVAGLERIFCPAQPGQDHRAFHLNAPVLGFSLARHVQKKMCVWILPLEPRHHPANNRSMDQIETGCGMVRRRRCAQQTDDPARHRAAYFA